MDIRYEGASSRRKELVKAIGEILNTEPAYQGAPTFGYSIGEVTVDRNGVVSFDDGIDPAVFDRLVDGLAARGFEAENLPGAEFDAEVETETEPDPPTEPEAETETGTEAQPETEGETDLETATVDHADETAPDPIETGLEWNQLVIEIPREGFSETAIANLERLLASKASLIKNALGVDSLAIEVTDETIRFPWFSGSLSPEEINAYARFIGALCAMAKSQKRVTATEKTADNEKYAFRCFLLRLGFIGQEYRTERRVLLSKLTGSSAWKTVPAASEEVTEA